MVVGLMLGNIIDEIGSHDFFYAFFSTISYRLEPNGWGSRFPLLLKNLYLDKLDKSDAQLALNELNTVREELAKLSPDDVVWDFERLDLSPPWRKNISPTITSLANYFVTSTGRDLISVIKECLIDLRERGGIIKIVKI